MKREIYNAVFNKNNNNGYYILNDLIQSFYKREVGIENDLNKVNYAAGQQSVVEYVIKMARLSDKELEELAQKYVEINFLKK